MRRNAIPELSVVSLMTSALGQSSNQGCREFLDVMGKSDQPSWLPPLTEISLGPVDQALEDLLNNADMVAARAMQPATARKPMGCVVGDCWTIPVSPPPCLSHLRHNS